MFVEYEARSDLSPFASAGGDLVKPEGTGTVFFQIMDPRDSSKTIDWTVQGVDYTPLSPANLLSPGKLRKAGIDEEIYIDVIEKVFRDPYFAHTRLDPTTTYTPSMNGSVERAGRTIVEAARTQLIESGLGEDLWDYSVDSTIQILNLLPSMSKGKLSPHEIMARELNLDVDRETPRIMHLRTWGCVAYVHKKGPNRPLRSSKMEARAMKGYLVGYDSLRGHIYHIYVPEEDKVFRCRDVRFHEEPGKTVLNLLAKEPLRSNVNHDVLFQEPDIAIPYAVAKFDKISSSDEADTTDKADKQIEITLMSPPPKDMDSSESQSSGITIDEDMYTDAQQCDSDDDFADAVVTQETDFRNPNNTDPANEATAEAETTTQGRSRRATTIKDPGYYRLAHGVRSYNKKAFLAADVAVAQDPPSPSISYLAVAVISKILPQGITIPTTYKKVIESP
ncbi:reverse transcriptase domain protein [Colletotrichum musicola]|uniref:Reverse transcriptase domain protein n=1 Tax=Colletotrichum musicola TaxID=2175873 RepID=A0A8H6IP63_9PEZI|nr:reverse transcriptase domain protein [Colletotrichum musicola]